MKPGDKVELVESIEFQIKANTDMSLGMGLPGLIVSKINMHGFCSVQFNICDNVHITTQVHKNMLKLNRRIS